MERRFRIHLVTGVIAAAMVGLIGCASTPEPMEGPDTGSEWEEAPIRGTERSASGAVPTRGPSGLQTIYFDFDRFDVRQDARPALRNNADGMRNGGGVVTIEGHCDERGSEEYNLALGERRANATKRYLVDLGVPASNLRTVSFGEARPAVQGHDESAWRYNRRAEFRNGG